MDQNILLEKISYLEGKCALLTRHLENSIMANGSILPRDTGSEMVILELRHENERLQKRIDFIYKTVSWVITKPLREIKIPSIDRWWRKKMNM